MLSASDARKSIPEKPKKNLETYLSERISDSASQGFYRTKAWVDNTDLDEATEILHKAGYRSEAGSVDANRTQLVIKWENNND